MRLLANQNLKAWGWAAVPTLTAGFTVALPDPVWASSGPFCLVLAAVALVIWMLRRRLFLGGFSAVSAWAVYLAWAILSSKIFAPGALVQTFIFFTLCVSALAAFYYVEKMTASQRKTTEMLQAEQEQMAKVVREREEEFNRISKSLYLEIRAHIEAESRLRESEEKYRYLVNSLPEGVFIVQDRQIVFFNPALEQLTGFPEERLSAMDPACLMQGPEGTRDDRDGYLNFFRADGSRLILDSQRVDIRFKDKPAQLCTVRDMTDRVKAARDKERLESELEKAKKMEALGLMAAGVAHDLNNVLAGVVSTPDLLLMELPRGSRLKETVLTIKDAGKRASVIVDELLTLGKGAAGPRESVGLNQVVSRYLESPEFHRACQFHPAVRLDTRLDADLPQMSGSWLHMHKVVMNLVSNAMEAIPDQGRILLTTGRVKFHHHPLKGYDTQLDGEYVKFTVSDSGPGISPEDLERIFEPFYTKKILGRSGTGLGLSIVWNLVHDHKGYIQVKSSREGTCFDIYFPVDSTLQHRQKPDRIYTLSDYTGNGESLLVVDDEPNQLKITSNMLRRMGYRVAAVPSGEAAVDHVCETCVDLVILDMIMAPGIDGYETFSRLKAVCPAIRTVLVSGYAKTREAEQAQAEGAGAFLKKPFSLQDLGLAVKHELERQNR